MITKNKYISSYLRYIRNKKNIEESIVCAKCDITRVQLYNIESGICHIPINVLKRICDALEIDFIRLFSKQDKYEEFLDEVFQSIIYLHIQDDKKLQNKMRDLDIESSVLYPKYVLINMMMKICISSRTAQCLKEIEECDKFIDVYGDRMKFFYYLYRAIFDKKNGRFKEVEYNLQEAKKYVQDEDIELLWFQQGFLCMANYQFVEGLNMFQKAYKHFEKKWNIRRMLNCRLAIGVTYTLMREYASAHVQLQQTYILSKKYHYHIGIYKCYVELCMNAFYQHKYKEAYDYGMECLRHSDEDLIIFVLLYVSIQMGIEIDQNMMNKTSNHIVMNELFDYAKKSNQSMKDDINVYALIEKLNHEFSHLKAIRRILIWNLANEYHAHQNYQQEAKILRLCMEY